MIFLTKRRNTMLKRHYLALTLALLPALAFSQTQSVPVTDGSSAKAANPIYVSDPNTGNRRELTFKDAKSPEVLRSLLPAIEGVSSLFDAYINTGYAPFHAYILTNADIITVLRKVSPTIAVRDDFQQKIDSIRGLYQAKE
jgi:hypothetical protein